jgi:hypothetical protein
MARSSTRSGGVQVPALLSPIDVIVVATGYVQHPLYVARAHPGARFSKQTGCALHTRSATGKTRKNQDL